MPQMMPINWILSLLLFIMIFIIFNIFNYFIFNYKNNTNFKKNNYKSNKIISWKW
uniref:ATP synthase F0 subunit 8 n=1 Tax=Cirrochroa tyche TaxID=681779 RepID=UPI0027A35BF4|nr:ATP synthase F0 subunit 8 [Cirrochroa tyche]WGN99206.1 ATP synthase F0 subunit 8 [Cirrochroa tyche]